MRLGFFVVRIAESAENMEYTEDTEGRNCLNQDFQDFQDRRLNRGLSELRITRRTRKTWKGVLGISRYFHNYQVLCQLRNEKVANFTPLLMRTLRTKVILLGCLKFLAKH